MDTKLLKPENLILDLENPRFGLTKSAGEEDALKYLFDNCDIKELWNSIIENGFLTYEPLVAYQPNRDVESYIVIEGNRRLAAIKTLLNPELISSFSRVSVPEVPEKYKSSLKEILVNIVDKREDADSYIGFRHVNGARSWEPLPKAKFGLKLLTKLRATHPTLSDKERVDILSRQIGDQSTQIIRNLFSYKVLQQALSLNLLQEDFLEKTRNDFSHLYSILSNPETRDYIGLGTEALRADQIQDTPIPETHHKRLSNLITWLYGSPDGTIAPLIIRQGTDRPHLQKVIASTDGLKTLEVTGNFEAAKRLAGIDIESWLTSVYELDNRAQKVFENSSDVVDTLPDDEKEKAKGELRKTIGRLEKILKILG